MCLPNVFIGPVAFNRRKVSDLFFIEVDIDLSPHGTDILLGDFMIENILM